MGTYWRTAQKLRHEIDNTSCSMYEVFTFESICISLHPIYISFGLFKSISTPKAIDGTGEQDAAAANGKFGGLDIRTWDHFGAFWTLDEAEEDA